MTTILLSDQFIKHRNTLNLLSLIFNIDISHQFLINNFIIMQQNLNFLSIIDSKIKRSRTSTPKQSTIRAKTNFRRTQRFPYAKAIDFNEDKYVQFPNWLTQKEGFIDFMYQNYESKLMSIPKICQKKQRASDQRYFINLYLQQLPFFKQLPPIVTEIILGNITTQYLKVGEIIHSGGVPNFLGVVFVGSIQLRQGKKLIVKQKNEVILTQSFYDRAHQAVVCKQQTILLVLKKEIYTLILTKMRQEIETKQRDEIADMLKSTFFTELHIKDKKARTFYNDCFIKFYFDGQVIAEAGEEVKFFYIIFRGRVQEQNHIYIREHNKWPLPSRKWQVRAVYNSYHKRKDLNRFQFFGDQEIISNSKFKSKYIAAGWVTVFAMPVATFISSLSSEDIKRLKKYRSEHVDINYNEFQQNIRDKVRSLSEHRNIIKKAINGSLAHRDDLTSRKMKLISNFEKSMLTKTFFRESYNVQE